MTTKTMWSYIHNEVCFIITILLAEWKEKKNHSEFFHFGIKNIQMKIDDKNYVKFFDLHYK